MYLSNTKKISSSLVFALMGLYSFAQDSTASATTTTNTSSTTVSQDWYTQPWVWVVGGIVVLIILIAMFSGGNKTKGTTDRVIVTKTVRTETDTD